MNCMTWVFPAERIHYAGYGPFAAYVFQSNYQLEKLGATYRQLGASDKSLFHIRGAFDASEYPYLPRPRRASHPFIVGRLARPDLCKWSERTWAIYAAVKTDGIRARVMGSDERVEAKLGPTPPWAEVLPPCAEGVGDFLRSLHCLLPINGGAEENWPRVGLEAMAAGVPIVTENKWGWREMIDHGRTGYLADSDDELVYYTRRLALDEPHRLWIARNARQRLLDELANPLSIGRAWEHLFQVV
jgi:glycosyltransferase involved in cell wall biosynthesis